MNVLDPDVLAVRVAQPLDHAPERHARLVERALRIDQCAQLGVREMRLADHADVGDMVQRRSRFSQRVELGQQVPSQAEREDGLVDLPLQRCDLGGRGGDGGVPIGAIRSRQAAVRPVLLRQRQPFGDDRAAAFPVRLEELLPRAINGLWVLEIPRVLRFEKIDVGTSEKRVGQIRHGSYFLIRSAPGSKRCALFCWV